LKARKTEKKSRWELQAGELPPDWILAKEPGLEGLENNAIFRLGWMGFHKRSGNFPFLYFRIGILCASYPSSLLILDRTMDHMVGCLPLALAFCALSLPIRPSLSMLSFARIESDILASPITATEYANAVWGWRVCERIIRENRQIAKTGLAIGSSVVLLSAVNPHTGTFFPTACMHLLISTAVLVGQARLPHGILLPQSADPSSDARFRALPLYRKVLFAFIGIAVFGFALASIMLLGISILFLGSSYVIVKGSTLLETSNSLSMRLLYVFGGALVSVGLGSGIGLAVASVAKKYFVRRFEWMTLNLGRGLERLRERTFERVVQG